MTHSPISGHCVGEFVVHAVIPRRNTVMPSLEVFKKRLDGALGAMATAVCFLLNVSFKPPKVASIQASAAFADDT